MMINYLAVIVCSVLSLVVGAIWYGPLFGKTWLAVIGADAALVEKRNEMQKSTRLLYLVQFLLSLFQIWILAYYIAGWQTASGVVNALWIWAAFIMPTIAGASMWNLDPTKVKWARFLIQSGYQLVMLVIYGLILGLWK
ncbi:MAG: DUF1761 domain-containing protein [Candidatus Paceibacterota bacterium]